MVGNEPSTSRVFSILNIIKPPAEDLTQVDNVVPSKSHAKLDTSLISLELKLLSLCAASNISVCFLHSCPLNSVLIFFLPSIIGMFLICCFGLCCKMTGIKLNRVMIMNLSLYCISAIVLIFSDMNIFSKFIGNEIASPIPSMYYLILLSTMTLITLKDHSRLILVLNVIFGIFTFGMNLRGLQPVEVTIYQFILFLLMLPLRPIIFRKKRKVQDCYVLSERDEESTPIERVMKMLGALLDNFEQLSECANCEKISKMSYSILESSVKILRNTPNIYSSNIDHITRNMNEQDKLFIEQSCSEMNIYSSMNDSEGIKENINAIYGVTDLAGVLKKIGNEWNFNMFFVNDCSGNHPLIVCGEYIIKRYNFDKYYKIPEAIYTNFLSRLEEGYLPNQYHNCCHAADMMCSFLFLLTASGYIKKITSLELLSCVIACMGHDIGHKGKNNRFLILSKDPIAIRYCDMSVQEMMHAAILYEILLTPDYNILSGLSNDQWFSVRKIVVEMILSTDMAKHFEILGAVKAKYLNSLQVIDLENAELKLDVCKNGIKCADLAHAAKDIELHKRWCGLLIQEFYEQGDMEKELGLPVSMYCDRETTDISKSQAGFLKNIVEPIYASLNNLLHSSEIEINCIAQIKKNKNYWSLGRSLSKNYSVMMKKQVEEKDKQYLELMDISGALKRSCTPFIVNLAE